VQVGSLESSSGDAREDVHGSSWNGQVERLRELRLPSFYVRETSARAS
jgi:hypothetical protein